MEVSLLVFLILLQKSRGGSLLLATEQNCKYTTLAGVDDD
jgi:preprotein translocase subunit SecG